jgi:hypothetical protein
LSDGFDQVKTQVAPRTYGRYAEIARNNLIPALGAIRLVKLRPEHISEAYSKALIAADATAGAGYPRRPFITCTAC